MKDFQTLNETPYYENLNSGNTDNQNYSSQHQTLTPINQQNQNDGRDAIYRSPDDCSFCAFGCGFFLLGILASSFMITSCFYEKQMILLYLSPIPLIFTIIGSVFLSSCNIGVKINISSTLGTIKLTQKRIFCCYNIEKIIQINEVQKITIIDNDSRISVNFKLSNERGDNEMINISNKYAQRSRVLEILKNSLPKRIIFE